MVSYFMFEMYVECSIMYMYPSKKKKHKIMDIHVVCQPKVYI